jgi:RNA polymerase sigma-70 factor (ECF subfamily)
LDIDSLVRRARDGDKSAEKELFRHLSVRYRLFALYRIGNEQEAEDIVQDTMLTIAQKYKSIDPEASFTAWAYTILENNILYFFRTQKYNRRKLARFARARTAGIEDQEYQNLRQSLLGCLRQICRTNLKYARMLNLHYQGYTTEEICEKLDITKNHAYVLFSRAKSMLKECLKKGTVR